MVFDLKRKRRKSATNADWRHVSATQENNFMWKAELSGVAVKQQTSPLTM